MENQWEKKDNKSETNKLENEAKLKSILNLTFILTCKGYPKLRSVVGNNNNILSWQKV